MTTSSVIVDEGSRIETQSVVRPKRGSQLIKYDQCSLYDSHRQPVGIKFLRDRLRAAAERLRLPLRELTGTSLCCGTGQNEERLAELLRAENETLQELTLIDGSDGMLSRATQKLKPFEFSVKSAHCDVLVDDFPVERQDFVACIQAVQHFSQYRDDPNFSVLDRFYRRVHSLLVKGGEFFQIVSIPEQVLSSYWFYNLISGIEGVTREEDPAVHFANEHPPLICVFSALERAGFKIGQWKVIRRPHFVKQSYYGDPGIVLDEEFRHSSSIFWLMERRGLRERYDAIARARVEDGSAAMHRSTVEERRKDVGISIAVSATKK